MTEQEKAELLKQIQEDLNKKLESAAVLQKRINEERTKFSNLVEDDYDKLIKINELEQQRTDVLKETLLAKLKDVDFAKELLTDQQKIVELNAEYRDLGVDIAEIMARNVDETEKLKILESEINLKYEERKKQKQEEKKALDEIKGLNDSIASSLGAQASFSKTITGQMFNKAKALKKAGFSSFMVAGDFVKMSTISANVLDQVIKIAVGLDDASKAFGKMTGFSTQMAGTFQSVYTNTVAAGGSIEEAGQAMGALANNFAAFNPNAKETNENLATNLVLMQKIGVDSVSAAKSMDFFSKVMNKTAPEAANLTRQIAMMGSTMGVTASKMISDFQQVSGDIAMYGNRTMDVFKNLAAQAKQTGVEMSTLVSIGKQFDTFEGAADVSAKLNAVLGTSISTIDMMNMSYDQRVKTLKQELRAVGANMDSMDPYTQMYIAQALGVSSVAEAQRILNASQEEIDANQRKQDAANTRQEELLSITTQLVPISHQLKIAFSQMALALGPLISGITAIIQGFTSVNESVGGAFIPLLIISALLVKGLTTATIIYDSWLKISAASTGALTTAQTLKNLGEGASPALMFATVAAMKLKSLWLGITAGSLKAFALAAGIATFGILPLIGIIVSLIATIVQSNSPPFWQIFGVIALSLLAFGSAILPVVPLILGLMGAVAGLVLSITAMFYAMEVGAEPAQRLFNTFINSVDILPEFADGIYQIAASISVLGAAGIMAAASMAVLAASMMGVGTVFAVVGLLANVGILIVVANSMERIGAGMQAFASGLGQIASISSMLSSAAADGFIALNTSSEGTSMVIGSGDIMKNFVEGKITVDVNIPEMKMPETTVNVYLDGKKLEGVVKKVISRAG